MNDEVFITTALAMAFSIGIITGGFAVTPPTLTDQEKVVVGCEYIGGELSFYPQSKIYYCEKKPFNRTF